MKKKQVIMSLLAIATLMLSGCPTPSDGGGGGDPGGSWSGVKLTGATYFETFGESVAVDTAGNVIMAGYVKSETPQNPNILLDGQPLMGTNCMFVTKYYPSGNKHWTRALGLWNGYARATGVATDAAGNVYVTGYTQCAPGSETSNQLMYGLDGAKCVDDTFPYSASYTLFLTKYDTNGVKQWTRLQGAGSLNSGNVYAMDVVVSKNTTNPQVYVCGYATGAMNVLPQHMTAPLSQPNMIQPAMTGYTDIFVSKFDSDGILKYSKMVGTGGYPSYATSITLGNDTATSDPNYVFITGYTGGNLWGTGNGGTSMILGYAADFAPTYVGEYGFSGYMFNHNNAYTTADFRGMGISAGINSSSVQTIFVVGVTNGGYEPIFGIGSALSTVGGTSTGDGFFLKCTFNPGNVGYSNPFTIYTQSGNPDLNGFANHYLNFNAVASGIDGETGYVAGFADFTLSPTATYGDLKGVRDSALTQYPPNDLTNALLGNIGAQTEGFDIAVNSANQVFVVGNTNQSLIAVNGTMVQKTGGRDAFINKYSLNTSGGVVEY